MGSRNEALRNVILFPTTTISVTRSTPVHSHLLKEESSKILKRWHFRGDNLDSSASTAEFFFQFHILSMVTGYNILNIDDFSYRCKPCSRAYCPSCEYVNSSLVSYHIVQLIYLEPPPPPTHPVIVRFACLTTMSVLVLCFLLFFKILRNI